MATIRDIAGAAGVSVTTVSRVLNDHPYVSKDKRERVKKAMQSLGYSRNIHAVHLSKGFSDMIGVVLPSVNLPYFADLVAGIAEAAEASGVHLSLYQTDYQQQKERFALSQLQERQVDGLIICSKAIPDEHLLTVKEPLILCQYTDAAGLSSISNPHREAFRHGLDYLIEKGHRKIAISLARKKGKNSQVRIAAYKEALKKIGQPYREELVVEKALTLLDGKALFHRWKSWDDKPTALFAANDQVSAGLYLEAKANGTLIPEELAILSIDNHDISKMLGISTIDIQTKEMGKQAFHMLENRISGGPPARKVLDYRLIERSTV
ncbi:MULTISPECIES: LacI family DNA-binding transcriptional regulator [Bacillus amyloliquefaciens group]|uniref:LacI family DNA-binding transcriptional regulator n=1 Tax=Bacillus amyloliquefaciens group TaxID=1938374 RepID=UPI0003873A9A|nr:MULTISPECIES: LacI family DNA-binding transcriptional regulator [Bacillus amyloliquefaciens group]MBC2596979.1 LacI family DNA-binding transcriptional regulator [Bacillus velezensis]MBU5240968.1 LacI family DNA-binding transcriptional regulator [Bacillus velezensis]MCM3370594.1 LacI family DNA-binding transcriptional regulator [Bacillus velezensis]MDF9764933.1 DNA-binding LacI/PurR family transcriptional regulator [Bacillus velezensis]MDF9780156.1 DNA-binding LacI/PurR family transcriptiona